MRRDQHCCLFFVLQGEVMVWNSQGRWRVSPGHVFLSVVNDPSSGYAYPQDGKGTYQVLWFGFGSESMRSTIQDIIQRFGTVFAIDSSHPALQRLMGFQRLESSTCTFNPLEGASFVTEILASLHHVIWPPNHHQGLIQRALELKNTNSTQPLSVKELARRLGISREHLSRLFQKMQRMPLGKSMQVQRIEEACHLLQETSLSIKEISSQLHYTSPSNFARAFQKTTHLSPLKYRHGFRAGAVHSMIEPSNIRQKK